MEQPLDLTVPTLGPCEFDSPMAGVRFVADGEHVLHDHDLDSIRRALAAGHEPPRFELAGPRRRIAFDPARLGCGIVTCGGLCPGLNAVIRAVVLSLHHHYGVRRILGFPYGYEGLSPKHGHRPVPLTPESVAGIHETGGTILGSSRGAQDPAEMAATLAAHDIGILFALGGDGTLRGAQAIADAARQRGQRLAVVGIPKTIDNDISYTQKTFGFETAVAEARRVTYAAHSEAAGARNGVGLVKLMGRDSGFVAAYAALVDGEVNFCLVPEVPFTLPGLLAALERRLEQRGHAVIVVAEGAGQDLFPDTGERDASGNRRYGDVGVFLRDSIRDHFKSAGRELNLKYIDPSYTIRSVPANPHDAAFCLLLGHNAVHAGMAGRTAVVGFWSHQFTHVPIPLATARRKRIDPDGWLWASVLAATGQPRELK